jgi:hypothetical protein
MEDITMKRVLSTLVASVVALSFAGIVCAADPAPASAPPAPAPAAEKKKEVKKPARIPRKVRKAKPEKKVEIINEVTPAETPPVK